MGRICVILTLLLVGSCASTNRWPRWAEHLSSQLECGMGLEQIQGLTDRRTISWMTLGRLKTYHISGRQSDLWIYLNSNGLELIALGKVDGWRVMSTRFSPLKNLCTGELVYLVRLIWSTDLQGAEIFLDDRKVKEEDKLGPFIEVAAGDHELRIVKEGYTPVVKHLSLDSADRGDQQLQVTKHGIIEFGPSRRH